MTLKYVCRQVLEQDISGVGAHKGSPHLRIIIQSKLFNQKSPYSSNEQMEYLAFWLFKCI